MIARVFPRKTAMSPTDALAFFGPPTIENIADCIQAGVTEVHISVTFTWDLEKAEYLYYAWKIIGVPVGSAALHLMTEWAILHRECILEKD